MREKNKLNTESEIHPQGVGRAVPVAEATTATLRGTKMIPQSEFRNPHSNDTVLLDELAQLAARRIGLRIPDDARDRFAGMLRERAAHLGHASLKDYRTFLVGRQATEEWEEFARVFTTGETFFFRDHGQFDLLRLRLLPELIARHHHDKTLRLWSAGCASGEEVYSLAMLVDMLLPERGGWDILILGTDIDSAAIDKARRGRYGQWSFRMIPPGIQQRYFNAECGMRSAEQGDCGFGIAECGLKTTVPNSAIRNQQSAFILDERIRRMVTFRVANLVSDRFPDPDSELHDMDLILCRNVFIYFDPAATFAVAAKFAATLREGGYLLTAHTELIGHPVPILESRLFAEGVVYRRRNESIADSGLRIAESGTAVFNPQSAIPIPKSNTPQSEIRNQHVSLPPVAPVRITPPVPHAPIPSTPSDEALLKEARAYADCGGYDKAEQMCHKVLAINPLAAAPYFLLAQLAQLRGDFEQAKEYLNKAIYLDSRFVAAYLELAALCERADDMPRAQTLRRAALAIVRAMPGNEIIEQYETTAGELAQWLAQWEHDVT